MSASKLPNNIAALLVKSELKNPGVSGGEDVSNADELKPGTTPVTVESLLAANAQRVEETALLIALAIVQTQARTPTGLTHNTQHYVDLGQKRIAEVLKKSKLPEAVFEATIKNAVSKFDRAREAAGSDRNLITQKIREQNVNVTALSAGQPRKVEEPRSVR